ncbi:MAG: class I SAM-dependent methyltransferase [archaeon]
MSETINKQKCQICSSNNLYKFLSLGHHPNPGSFLTEEKIKEPEIFFPLDVYFCEDCSLVQLGYAPDPKILFTDSFIYTTGSNKGLVRDFHDLVEIIMGRFNLSEGDLAVDIGGNDGTLLENYLPYKISVLNIDPSKAAELTSQKKIPALKLFFNEETALKTLSEFGKAKIITATNVFAHVKELDSFMKGIKMLLDKKGVFIEESGYVIDLISKREYDSIYTEHLRYYSLKSLICLFNEYGMDIFDAQRIETHGGSMRVFACNKGDYSISDNILRILKEEEEFGLYSKETYDIFSESVFENRKKFREILFKIKDESGTIVGIGAPAKGNTLLNFCKIGTETIDCLLEYKSLKIGTYSPGVHIPIKEESVLFEEPQPTHALILAWNIKDIIIPKLREKGFRGKFIIPVPIPYIL